MQEFGTLRPADPHRDPGGRREGGAGCVDKVRPRSKSDYDYRRIEVVGPTVSCELARAGTIAVLSSMLAMMVYIWFRFEWQFAVGAIIATLHDVVLMVGFFVVVPARLQPTRSRPS